jgi:hypothetical protein
MSTTMNRKTYEELIKEDVSWLKMMPRTLEREHILSVLLNSADRYYGQNKRKSVFSNERCSECGKFMSYKEMEKVIVYIPYGSYGDLEPLEEEFIHRKCWNKMPDNHKESIKRISWQFSGE